MNKFNAREEARSLVARGVIASYVTDGRLGLSHAERVEELVHVLQRAYDLGARDARDAARAAPPLPAATEEGRTPPTTEATPRGGEETR